MNSRTLRALEYPKTLQRLAAEAASALGRERALALEPSADPAEVRARLEETSEARALSDAGRELSLGGVRDVREAVARARAGGTLEPQELLDLAGTIRAARRLARFFRDEPRGGDAAGGWAMRCPRLAAHAARLGDHGAVADAIEAAISDRGEVADGASRVLGRIRGQLRTAHARVKDRLQAMLRAPEVAPHLQELLVTVRGDRYVLPVRADARAHVPGVVHDQSSSGQTVFVEPLAIVELNNAIRRLEAEERDEVARILAELSGRVGAAASGLESMLEALGALDLAAAKARLSRRQRATAPAVNERGYLRLLEARHPLLAGEVVPVSVELGEGYCALLITGPNTGGKTVTLKTVGLLTLMAQAGLHVPAAEGSEVAVFSAVFADIGDEQSIEQNLSTFSAHMTNVVAIIDALEGVPGRRALVLLDELGAGTDPHEGAALGRALLEYLVARDVRTVATTHYSELKTFAYEDPRVENASVEFDLETLRPTYRLVTGVPGRSNAPEIADRLGLRSDIVRRARELLQARATEAAEVIARLEAARRAAEAERDAAAGHQAEARALQARLERELAAAARERAEALRRARDEAARVVARATREVEAAIAEVRQAAREIADLAAAREAERRVTEAAEAARTRLRELAGAMEFPAAGGPTGPTFGGDPGAAPPGEVPDPHELHPGRTVLVVPFGRQGTVVAGPDAGDRVTVQLGAVRAVVARAELRLPASPPGGSPRPAEASPRSAGAPPALLGAPGYPLAAGAGGPAGGEALRAAMGLATTCDLRGLTVEEATERLDRALDAALVAGAPRITIIHGKGTGALRRGILRYLRDHPHVQAVRPGAPGEGGAGVTVAYFEPPGAPAGPIGDRSPG